MKKEMFSTIFLLFLILAIPLTVKLTEQQQEMRKQATAPNIISPTPKPTPIFIDIWLQPVGVNLYGLMTKSMTPDEFDTVQLVFKNKKTEIEFTPVSASKFILRIYFYKNDEMVILLSTDGKLAPLPSSLGEFSISDKASVTALTIDPVRSKVIKAGSEFPVNFLGIKDD